MKIVKLAWSERREAALADAQSAFSRLLNIGQLVDFQWKIGLAVASGDVSRLGRPYVAVEFKIADTEGAVQHTNLELSLSDFQVGGTAVIQPATWVVRLPGPATCPAETLTHDGLPQMSFPPPLFPSFVFFNGLGSYSYCRND